jgi:hypothetical protein
MPNPAPMHKFLTGFAEYNKKLPIYIEKPFSDNQVARLREVIEINRNRMNAAKYAAVPGMHEEYDGEHRFDPKIITHMSRLMIEFDCPKDIEETMDSYCKPIHKKDIRLTHYNYIDYNMKYGEGRNAPSLPPHLDADENLVTFNYQIGGNVDDWQLWVDDTPYDLKNGDAIIFSAVNQVHWRSKRKWRPGEYVEIVSFDYCPITNYRWTGQDNPLDPHLFPEIREKYSRDLNDRPEFIKAWTIYHELGLKDGIPEDDIAGFAE